LTTDIKTTAGTGPVFGWTSAPLSFDRGTPNSLLRDGHFGTDKTFLVDVVAAGTYRVTLTTGDATTTHDNVQVTLNGVVQPNLITSPAGQFVSSSYSVTVASAPFTITLRLLDMGG